MVLSSKKVTDLPKSIGTLDWLQVLNLSDCSQLLELPDAIGELKALTELDLRYCSSLAALPDSISGLSALTKRVSICWNFIAHMAIYSTAFYPRLPTAAQIATVAP